MKILWIMGNPFEEFIDRKLNKASPDMTLKGETYSIQTHLML